MAEQVLELLRSPWLLLLILAVGLYCLWKGVTLLSAARWHYHKRAVIRLSQSDEFLTAKKILTPNEQEFYNRLKKALPELEVFPQVAMAAILQTTLDDTHPLYWQVRKLFSQKICDYVVCSQKLKLLAVVELDDRTHDGKKNKDMQRDALLAKAGISTVRWDSRAKPDEAAIRARFAPHLALSPTA